MFFSNELECYVFFGPAMVGATGSVLGHCEHPECTPIIIGHCEHVRVLLVVKLMS